ncbi:MAG: MFS transporter [Bacteroidetes bacterium]|nr:MAG: MFS transporter [Bacteroidota bacterium]
MSQSLSTLYVNKPGALKEMSASGYAIIFSVSFISSLFGGVTSTLMSVYLPIAVKDLLGNVSTSRLNEVGAYINAVFIFGWTFGGFIWGLISDRLGRAKSVTLSTACFGLFTLLTAFAPNWFIASVCRFLSGFGVGGVLVTTTILMSEAWSEKKRAVMLGFLSISIPVGIFSAGLINYFLPQWRQAFAVGLVPIILSVISIFILPESAKWKSNKNSPTRKEIGEDRLFASSNTKNLVTGSLIFGTMLIGMWAIFSWLPTWVQSFSSEDAQHQRGLSMMLLGAGGLTGGFISGWIVNAIGLRRTMLICFAVCLIMSFLLFKLNHSFSVAAYIEIAILALFFGISQGVLSVYIPGLFPTRSRAAATGFCFNLGRLFTGTAVFFVGALVTFLGGYGNAIFIFSLTFLVGFVVTYFKNESATSVIDKEN